MKNLIVTLSMILIFVSFASPQTYNISPIVDADIIPVYRDTIRSDDSTFIMYVPYSMNVLQIQAVAQYADTGSVSPAGVVTFYKFNPTTNIAESPIISFNIVAPNTVAYGRPSSSSAARLTVGGYYKIKIDVGTADEIRRLSLFIIYTR